jgi:non-specific serine/threonine protein kinase
VFEISLSGKEVPEATEFLGVSLTLGPRTLREDVALPPSPSVLKALLQWSVVSNIEIRTTRRLREWYDSDYELRRQRQVSRIAVEVPNLYPFQQEGVAWLAANRIYNGGKIRALIADDPRLGKSIQSLCAIRGIDGPILILCLKTLTAQWVEYVHNWLPERPTIAVLKGTSRWRRDRLELALRRTNPVIITNWETVHMDIPELFSTQWSVLIGDEAHRLKSRPRPSKKHPDKSSVVANVKRLKVTHIMLLSGTFVEKTPADWWQPLNILRPEIFSSFWTWVSWYVKTYNNGFGTVLVGAKNSKMMRSHLEPYVLRRKAEDVVDMPPVLYEDVMIDLPADHAPLYTSIKAQTIIELSNGEVLDIPNQVSRLVRLRQATIHPALLDASLWLTLSKGKYDALKDLVFDVIPEDEQVLIYSTFVDGAILAASVLGGEVIAGDISDYSAVDRFKESKSRILCSTPGKGGIGLNLYNANYVIYLDKPWSSIQWRQSRDRATAIGKSHSIMVYTLIVQDTIDEYVAKVLSRKMKVLTESDVAREVVKYVLDL